MNRRQETYNPISAYDFFKPTPSPDWLPGDPEIPEYATSNNDTGGTLYWGSNPVGANYPLPTGGTFVHPELLPPVRTYHLQ
jgi:hypothetical protein